MLTDTVNILDAYVVNIKVSFTITVLPDYNNNEVLLMCVDTLRTFFDIDNWNINQPIIKADMIRLLANTTGVQSVININIIENEDLANTSSIHGLYNLETAYGERG